MYLKIIYRLKHVKTNGLLIPATTKQLARTWNLITLTLPVKTELESSKLTITIEVFAKRFIDSTYFVLQNV